MKPWMELIRGGCFEVFCYCFAFLLFFISCRNHSSSREEGKVSSETERILGAGGDCEGSQKQEKMAVEKLLNEMDSGCSLKEEGGVSR